MGPLLADQLIYTNVEATQSPTKRRGYQTLFYTHGHLSDTVVRTVEPRLLYPEKGQPTKRLFFRMPTGQVVLAHLVPLPATDQFGRTGRYFAHTLIFSPAVFAQLANNPFPVFRHFPFWTTVEEAFVAGDMTTGDLPPAEIALPAVVEAPSTQEGLDRLPYTTRQALLVLAAQAPRLLEEHRAIAFLGQTDSIYHMLEGLFAVLPPRYVCTAVLIRWARRGRWVACRIGLSVCPQAIPATPSCCPLTSNSSGLCLP